MSSDMEQTQPFPVLPPALWGHSCVQRSPARVTQKPLFGNRVASEVPGSLLRALLLLRYSPVASD